MDGTDVTMLMREIGVRARAAAAELAFAEPSRKEEALNAAAEAMLARSDEILEANGRDLAFGAEKGLTPP